MNNIVATGSLCWRMVLLWIISCYFCNFFPMYLMYGFHVRFLFMTLTTLISQPSQFLEYFSSILSLGLGKYCLFYLLWKQAHGNGKKTVGYNLGQGIWNKIEKSNKTGQDKKSLISTFCVFFDCYWQSLFCGGEAAHWAMSPPLSLKSFSNSYTKFAILDITFHFACG